MPWQSVLLPGINDPATKAILAQSLPEMIWLCLWFSERLYQIYTLCCNRVGGVDSPVHLFVETKNLIWPCNAAVSRFLGSGHGENRSPKAQMYQDT